MLFQRPFVLSVSARWNVLLGLWLRGVPREQRESRCRQALDRVGLAGVAGRPARDLSGGQQQRLALARAWALQPDLLLVDANLPDEEIQALLRWVQGHHPALPCIVMTQTSKQRAQVKAWGAHSAIPRASLIDQLELVLSQSMQAGLQEIPF